MKILYVEDNAGDIGLLKSAFRHISFSPELHISQDGVIALEYLNGLKTSNEHIDLILLDLNIPKVNGYEVLKTIKSDSKLQKIPVMVFTSSQNEQERLRCIELGAEYAVKPLDYLDLVEFAKTIQARDDA